MVQFKKKIIYVKFIEKSIPVFINLFYLNKSLCLVELCIIIWSPIPKLGKFPAIYNVWGQSFGT